MSYSDFSGGSLFQDQPPPATPIPPDTQVVFVADMFVEDYQGGAELTTEALVQSCPLRVFKLHSHQVTMETLQQGADRFWVFGNFANLNSDLIPSIVANMDYAVLEYDYKYCKYRSAEKHQSAEQKPCDCQNLISGKVVSAFYYGAKSLWWMSERQQDRYHTMFPFLAEKPNVVLSSVFDDAAFAAIKVLREQAKDEERSGWIVLDSPSWIKGADAAKEWCREQGHEPEALWGLPYERVLEKLSRAEGFAYLPEGGDTCPRMVIEAKLLGCKLHLNENVEHAEELWFTSEDPFDTEAYLYGARERFWNAVIHDMNHVMTVSGYITTFNCLDQAYPFQPSVRSLLGFCDEVVVVDGGSNDGTWEKLQEMAQEDQRLVLHQQPRDWTHPRFAVFDGAQKALARSLCRGDFCWQQDSDEIVHEDDYEKIRQMVMGFPKQVDLMALPVIEYWGGSEKVRIDVNPWKWRLSRNKPHITHGIPASLRRYDASGELYSSPGSDGCDYVRNDNYEPIPFGVFMTPEAEQARVQLLQGNGNIDDYSQWFNNVITAFPGVHHYSWYDIGRKIRTYRDYWSRHWQSLYDVEQRDVPENNMFFDKSWKDVTEDEIDTLATTLAKKMGGWIFHSKLDMSTRTPHIAVNRSHPAVIDLPDHERE